MPPDALQLQLPLPQPQPGSERQETLADRLCDLLIRRGRPLEVGHVVAQVLRVRRCPAVLQRRLVAEIVDGDQRLAWRGRDLVGLAPPGWATRRLRDASYCVIDLETTGGSPGRSKITEIGAVRVRGGRIEERFSTLVDPGHPIPAPIVRITGIRDEMLVGQPRIDEAMERFVAFVGDDVMVAHNAPFDLRFLNYERFRIEGRYFTQPWLDTLVLSRRLLRRRVERFDLATLAEWADTAVRPNHRALMDAEATAELLLRLVDLLVDRGVGTLERAVGFGQTGGARHAHKLALAEDLPQAPGVYLMRDAGGAVLYVGKARNIRRRVRSYFGPHGKHSRLVTRALETVASIDHIRTDSELGALLHEARLIRELRPPCNSRGVRRATRYLKISGAGVDQRLFVVADVLDDGAAYFGPVRSDRTARAAVAALHTLFGLRDRGGRAGDGQASLIDPTHETGRCGLDDAFARIRRILSADRHAAASILMDHLAREHGARAAMAEPAGREGLESLLAVVGTLARVRAAAGVRGAVVEATREGAVAVLVADGRLVRSVDLRAGQDGAVALRAVLAEAAESLGGPAGREAGDMDEALIIHDWMRARADQPGVVRLRGDLRDGLGPLMDAVRAVAPACAGPPDVALLPEAA